MRKKFWRKLAKGSLTEGLQMKICYKKGLANTHSPGRERPGLYRNWRRVAAIRRY